MKRRSSKEKTKKKPLIYGRYNTCPPACYKIRTGKGHQCSNLPWSAVIRGEGRGRQRGRDRRRILTMIFNRARLLFMLQLIQQGGAE